MSPIDRLSAWLITQLSVGYLGLHSRAPYRFITPYRVLVRSLGRRLLRRVLDREPLELPEPKPGDACIHLLTKGNEVLFALWACRSLLEFLESPIPVYVHDDGSLGAGHVRAIESSLPGVRVVLRSDADPLVHERLAGLPRCLELRKTNVLSMKLFDPWIAQEAGDAILLDSDVLFFRKPLEIVRWLESPAHRTNRWNMSPVRSGHRPSGTDELRVPEGFNSGIGLVTRDSVCFERAEELLAHPWLWSSRWMAEQRLYGLLSAAVGMEALPPTYHIADGGEAHPEALVAKHYVGTTRGLFVGEGIPWLLGRAQA